jgi:hypothetical protein
MKSLISTPSYGHLLASAVLTVACLLMTGSALANTVTVTSLADSGPGTLRAALASTGPGGAIVFQPGLTGTITLTSGELDIGRNLTITGPGATSLAISGNNNSRVFNISFSNATVSISGLTISAGLAQGASGSNSMNPDGAPGQGGGIINSGALTLTLCVVEKCTALGGNASAAGVDGGDGSGGGIFSSGTLTLVSCQIESNEAIGGAGAIDSTESGSGWGGGISSSGTLDLTNCTLNDNLVKSGNQCSGGGIWESPCCTQGFSLVNCTIAHNIATGGDDQVPSPGAGYGGGIAVDIESAGSTVLISCCTISGNSAIGLGGAYSQGVGGGFF